jgi:hypothetical protein
MRLLLDNQRMVRSTLDGFRRTAVLSERRHRRRAEEVANAAPWEPQLRDVRA